MKYHWLLDNGHGGVEHGIYITCPTYNPSNPKTFHKMNVFPDGTTIYEGDFNRKIVDIIAGKLCEAGINNTILVPETKDITLSERVKRANDYYKRDKSCIFVSIHGNWFHKEHAKGYEVFTSKGYTRSDDIAQVFANKFEEQFPKMVMRWDLTDGDKDKEANYYVLKNTLMPAILTENGFMSNLEDAKLMLSREGQERIAQAHINAILHIEKDSKRY